MSCSASNLLAGDQHPQAVDEGPRDPGPPRCSTSRPASNTHSTPTGADSELIAFDNIVPTGLAVRGNTVYMAQAGPVPHLPEDGKILSFRPKSPTASLTEVASGGPLLVDVEFGRGRTLYALAQGEFPPSDPPGSPAAENTGQLLKVNDNGPSPWSWMG
jgi:hypothetical protein